MRKRTRAVVAVLGVLLAAAAAAAIAGPTVYRNYFVAPAAELPLLSADASALSNSSEAASAESFEPAEFSGTWVVTDGSYAGYRVDEVLYGEAVTVTGRTDQVSGTLQVNELTLESAHFTVDVASISTDKPQRDQYFRDDALRTSTYPTASFELTEPISLSETPAPGEVIEQTLNGELTLAGVTQRVTFTVQLRTDGEKAELAGQIPITFADYGVDAPSLGFVKVEPAGLVEFMFVAELS